MIKHKIKNFLAFFAVCILLYPAVILQNVYASNLLIFFSSFIAFFMFLGFMMSVSYSKVKHPPYSPLQQTYIDGKHLPKWMDISFYIIIIGALASYGWWYTTICWTITAVVDLEARSHVEELKQNDSL